MIRNLYSKTVMALLIGLFARIGLRLDQAVAPQTAKQLQTRARGLPASTAHLSVRTSRPL